MNRQSLACLFGSVLLVCLAGSGGLLQGADSTDEVKATFKDFQAALKAKDADRIWKLLDSDSQNDAEREARKIRTAFSKATPAEQAKLEKNLGLLKTELTALKGPGFLKTKLFQGKYDEIPGSKIDHVAVQEDSAAVAYVEEDGDKEKLKLVRQGGKWKVIAPMPKFQR